MEWLKRQWKLFLAQYRLNLDVVCEMSKGMGATDFHDYWDTENKIPMHMVMLKCERCGKKFMM